MTTIVIRFCGSTAAACGQGEGAFAAHPAAPGGQRGRGGDVRLRDAAGEVQAQVVLPYVVAGLQGVGTGLRVAAPPRRPLRLQRARYCEFLVTMCLRGDRVPLRLMVRVAAMSVDVEVVREASDEILKAFGRLLPQLSRSAEPLDVEALRALVTWPGNRQLIARVDGEIVGALTLVMFPIPTGLRAWIEDVVVDGAARGHGVGSALTLEAVRLARAEGARTVDLTSRPSRVPANRLYERLGFQLRDSKVYRLDGEL